MDNFLLEALKVPLIQHHHNMYKVIRNKDLLRLSSRSIHSFFLVFPSSQMDKVDVTRSYLELGIVNY